MDFDFLLRGFIVGLSIAAPVGPIGVLCIKRTMSEGRLHGLVSGLGAATADAFYGCVAGFGLIFISDFLMKQRTWLQLAGGIFLCALGVKTFLSQPAEGEPFPKGTRIASAYVSTFILTITNPMTILSFTGIFAGLDIGGAGGNYASAAALVLGVFLGSALWWLALSVGVGQFRSKLNSSMLVWVNRISGMIIVAFGLIALISLLLEP